MAGCAFLLASLTQFTSEPSLGASPNTSRKKLAIRPYGRNCTTLRYTTSYFTLAS